MRKLLVSLLVFLLVAAIAGYFLYPTLSDQIAQRRDAATMKEYRIKTAAMESDKKSEMLADAKAYNESLESIRTEDVFTAGVPRTSRDYQNRLNIHSGVIAELVIPKIALDLPVYHLSAETPATRKLVHVDGSSLPANSERENIVLAGPGILQAEGILGDIGLTEDRMLEELDSLVPGDLLILNVLDRTAVYRVNEIQMLSSAGLKELDLTPEEEKQYLTLVTQRKDRRLLVRTEQITLQEARNALEAEDYASHAENWQNVLLLGSPVILAGLFILWVIERIKKRSYMLPGEGRNAEKREKKAREKLRRITTENETTPEPEETDEQTKPAETNEGEKT